MPSPLPILPDGENCHKKCQNMKEIWVQTHPDDFGYQEGAECLRFSPGIGMSYGEDDPTPKRWRACVRSVN